jgi:hypothetical protein
LSRSRPRHPRTPARGHGRRALLALTDREAGLRARLESTATALAALPPAATPADLVLANVLVEQAALTPAGDPLERCEARAALLQRMQALQADLAGREHAAAARSDQLRARLSDFLAVTPHPPAFARDRIAGLLDKSVNEQVERSAAQQQFQLQEAQRLMDALDVHVQALTRRGALDSGRG